ncbi:K02A2.6-like [Cordylochernes scorpioides]|uniref:RNA-directed DNA polymerase n=1 Tax=Cordylochernes scorpioides TaxID=51811 RepID=A0ABY6L302_9ARAC|nr:K02A2.6-like [Cordylochernes scorpioides]
MERASSSRPDPPKIQAYSQKCKEKRSNGRWIKPSCLPRPSNLRPCARCTDAKSRIRSKCHLKERNKSISRSVLGRKASVFSSDNRSLCYLCEEPVDFSDMVVFETMIMDDRKTRRWIKDVSRRPQDEESDKQEFSSISKSSKISKSFSSFSSFNSKISKPTASIEEHLALLKTIFARLAKYNIKLKKEKCLFLQKEIEYLGHLVTGEGIRPLDHKVQAIQKAKTPMNISELRSFLGLVNFYGKFIPNLPELLKPLHELLHKKRPWVWTKECGEAIDKCKNSITSERVLVPYDTTLPLCLATDASQIGVGAVLSHIIEGQERPIMFASWTLSEAEQNYSQIEKEALAIIYGVTKFHQFIYGRKFILITDHKPLVTILGSRSGIPTLSTSRLQRWALILSAYTYDIKFRRTQYHGNADLLSRFPVGCEEIPRLNNVYALSYVEELPITAEEIATETEKDEVLSLAKFYTQQGWPEKVADHLRPYFQRKLELTVDGECLVWGMRVVIPPSLRIKMLNCLHETHSGMNKMKAVARSHFWWPNLDTQIEFLVNKCRSCQQSQDGPNKGKWQPWKWSTRPWQRIHIDFANKENINLLIVVDSHSKWIEAIPMRETTTRKTIEQLRRLFSSYGLPEELVSDNGPQFTGSEIKGFLEGIGIKQTLIPAYHPQSNGLVERAVRTIKTALDKNKRKIGDTHTPFKTPYQKFFWHIEAPRM